MRMQSLVQDPAVSFPTEGPAATNAGPNALFPLFAVMRGFDFCTCSGIWTLHAWFSFALIAWPGKTCTSTRKELFACMRMKLYLNHMRRGVACMFYTELTSKLIFDENHQCKLPADNYSPVV